MRLEFEYQGKTYKTASTTEIEKDEAVEKIYDSFASMEKMKLDLEDGSTIIIGETALKSGVLRVFA